MTASRGHAARAVAAAALAAASALAAPSPARAGPPTDAVLHLAATSLTWSGGALADGRRAPALAIRLPADEGDADAGALERLPAWVRHWIGRWDPWDGSGYRLLPSQSLSLIGAWERPSGTEPLVIEPEEPADSPRSRIVGDGAHTALAVLDLSELPRVLVALGAGGGRSHLHAYVGWQVAAAPAAPAAR